MTESTHARPTTHPARRQIAWADGAGVLGAVLAALCCMGLPAIVGVLAAVGASWLRQDAILWPLMFASLALALWGFIRDWRTHGRMVPLILGGAGAASLVAGVVFVHGAPARAMIYAGTLALLAATAWNIGARRSHAVRMCP